MAKDTPFPPGARVAGRLRDGLNTDRPIADDGAAYKGMRKQPLTFRAARARWRLCTRIAAYITANSRAGHH